MTDRANQMNRVLFVFLWALTSSSQLFASQIDQDCLASIATVITEQRETTSKETWSPAIKLFWENVGNLSQAWGHGTSSILFDQILENGLRTNAVADATCQNICVSDLKKPDGFLAAYPFAIGRSISALTVNSQKLTGRDIVYRFSQVNPLIDSWWKKFLLRRMGNLFLKNRKTLLGYPVYLVFEPSEEMDFYYRRPTFVPSEIQTKGPLSIDRLRFVLVPASEVKSISIKLLDRGLKGIKVLPLEIFELEAVEKFYNTRPWWLKFFSK